MNRTLRITGRFLSEELHFFLHTAILFRTILQLCSQYQSVLIISRFPCSVKKIFPCLCKFMVY